MTFRPHTTSTTMRTHRTARAVLTVLALLPFAAFSQQAADVSPIIGFNLPGTHRATAVGIESKAPVSPSMTIALEVASRTEGLFSFGGGIQHLSSQQLSPERLGSFNFTSVYGLVKLQFARLEGRPIGALVGHAGYNVIFSGDPAYSGNVALRGRIYWGAGLRVYASRVFLQLMYRSLQGTGQFSSLSLKADVTYTSGAILLGVVL